MAEYISTCMQNEPCFVAIYWGYCLMYSVANRTAYFVNKLFCGCLILTLEPKITQIHFYNLLYVLDNQGSKISAALF